MESGPVLYCHTNAAPCTAEAQPQLASNALLLTQTLSHSMFACCKLSRQLASALSHQNDADVIQSVRRTLSKEFAGRRPSCMCVVEEKRIYIDRVVTMAVIEPLFLPRGVAWRQSGKPRWTGKRRSQPEDTCMYTMHHPPFTQPSHVPQSTSIAQHTSAYCPHADSIHTDSLPHQPAPQADSVLLTDDPAAGGEADDEADDDAAFEDEETGGGGRGNAGLFHVTVCPSLYTSCTAAG